MPLFLFGHGFSHFLEAKATGLSSLFGITCDNKAPSPNADASQARERGSLLLYATRTLSVANTLLKASSQSLDPSHVAHLVASLCKGCKALER